MKYAKFLMALAVACILIMPAFSMPDNGVGQNDGKNKWGPGPIMGPDGKDNQCNCQKPMEQDNQCGCHKFVKSMMDGKDGKFDGKQNDQCKCQNFMGKDDKQLCHKPIKSMMEKTEKDGKQICHRPIKSMMGSHDGIKAVIVTVKVIS
ncbi:MAG: hypothetical protein ACE14P_08605 [Methanotrichaceae archaeon]